MSILTEQFGHVFGYLMESDNPAVRAELIAAAESAQREYGPMPEWWAESFWTHNHLPAVCVECGHRHAGPAYGGICIGCPCPIWPAGGRGVTV